MELLKEASKLGVNLYEEHQRFVTSFDPRWRTNENVMLLLSAIALFSPDRANVLHKDVVKLEQVRARSPGDQRSACVQTTDGNLLLLLLSAHLRNSD